jgi:hypothetical protein
MIFSCGPIVNSNYTIFRKFSKITSEKKILKEEKEFEKIFRIHQ